MYIGKTIPIGEEFKFFVDYRKTIDNSSDFIYTGTIKIRNKKDNRKWLDYDKFRVLASNLDELKNKIKSLLIRKYKVSSSRF